MGKYLRLTAIMTLVVIIATLGGYLASNSHLNLSGSSIKDGTLTLNSDLPNMSCKKVLRFQFPPVRLECEEKEIDTSD